MIADLGLVQVLQQLFLGEGPLLSKRPKGHATAAPLMEISVGILIAEGVLSVLNVHHGGGLVAVNPNLDGASNAAHIRPVAHRRQAQHQQHRGAQGQRFANGNMFGFHFGFLL